MEIPITRPFFVFPQLSRETAEKFLEENPDCIKHLSHSDLAYDMWLYSYLTRASLFYLAQKDWYYHEVFTEFCYENKVSPDESFDYDLEEDWKVRRFQSGLHDWIDRSDQLHEDIAFQLDYVVRPRIGLKRTNHIDVALNFELDLAMFELLLDELWFNQTINNSLKVQHELQALPYNSYLKTIHWKRLRSAMFLIHHGACQEENCATSGDTWYFDGWDTDIHVHHLSYANRGNERYRDVILLCKTHHNQWHMNKKNTGESGINIDY